MLVMSDINTGATAIDFLMDDVEDLGNKAWTPVKVLKADHNYYRQPTKVYHLDDETSPTYTPLPETYDGIQETFDIVEVGTDDRILVGYSAPFDAVYVNVIDGNGNDVAAVLTVSYFNGLGMVAVAGKNDGTDSSGDSMKVDGTITWTNCQGPFV